MNFRFDMQKSSCMNTLKIICRFGCDSQRLGLDLNTAPHAISLTVSETQCVLEQPTRLT